MSNIWVHQSGQYPQYDQPYDRFDSSEVFYKGNRAKEIWYKGKKIWDGCYSFWKWNNNATLTFSCFQSREYYIAAYQSYPTACSVWRPISADIINEPTGSQFEEDFYIEPQNENSRSYPPAILYSDAFTIKFERKTVNSFNFLMRRNEAVDMRLINYFWQTPYGTFDVRTYQTIYPFAQLYASVNVPPGDYGVYSNFISTYGLRSTQFYHVSSRSYMFSPEGYNKTDNLLLYTKNLTVPGQINISVGVGGSYGAASEKDSSLVWSPYVERSAAYWYMPRAGQIRGWLTENEDGSGRSYTYVVNDYQDGDGLTHDPTRCIDPETGEYIKVEHKNYRESGVRNTAVTDWDIVYTLFDESKNTIYVSFREKYVVIQKRKGDDRKDDYKMRLYYVLKPKNQSQIGG